MKHATMLCAIVFLALLLACAPAPSAAPPINPTAAPAAANPTTPPQAAAAPYTVTWYQSCPWVSDPLPDLKDDFVHQYILQKYNIDLQVTFNAECDDAKTAAMVASGDLPDFMQAYWTSGNPTLAQLIDQGVILPIDVDKYPGIKNAISPKAFNYLMSNGKVWGFAPPADPTHFTSWVRQDWLDKIKLKTPTTPEEALAVATAFTSQDPDGNGKNDTYGFTSYVGSDHSPFTGVRSFFAPFGFVPGQTDLMIKDNKAYFPGLSENAKQGLMWFKQVIDAKAIDPAWSVNTEDQFHQTVADGKAGMMTYYLYMLNPNYYNVADQIKAKGDNAKWVWMDPLTGPAGKYMMVQPYANGIGNAFFVSQKTQSDPAKFDAMMKFLDDAINTKSELYREMVWGEKGKTYEPDANGGIAKYDRSQFKWQGNYRLFRTGNNEYRVGSWESTYPLMVEGFARADKLPVAESVRGLVPALPAQSDLDTYVAEMHLKFVTGEESFDNWDKFVNEAMTKFKGQEILDDANAKLKALGLTQ